MSDIVEKELVHSATSYLYSDISDISSDNRNSEEQGEEEEATSRASLQNEDEEVETEAVQTEPAV